jgi:hypothetical protein
MKRTVAAVLGLTVLLAMPAFVAAKGETSRITITGGNLTKPLDITDRSILKDFNVWTGPGVTVGGVEQAEGFIVDWPSGTASALPSGLHRYQVSFFVEDRNGGPDALVYVVEYERGSDGPGYVYLPGPTDEKYALNTRAIYRRQEGNWFRATDTWDRVANVVLLGLR